MSWRMGGSPCDGRNLRLDACVSVSFSLIEDNTRVRLLWKEKGWFGLPDLEGPGLHSLMHVVSCLHLSRQVCARAPLRGVLCPVDVWCLPLQKPPGCGGRGLHLGDLISPNHFPKARPLHIMAGLSFHPHNPSNKGLWGLNPSGEGTVCTRKQVPG